MKAIFKVYLLFFAVVLSTNVFAQSEKSKKISEKYAVTDDKLDIENKYGKVHINTWDKKEITVDITIKAWGKDEEKAQAILDKIKVDYSKTGNLISFKTNVGDFNININSKNGFEINYEVNMPADNELSLKNKYGSTFIGNFRAKLDVDVKYGNLKTNRLTGVSKDVKVAYGNLDIDEIENGEIDISYGKGSVLKAGDISLDNRYTSFTFGSVKKIDGDTKYGSLIIDDYAERISGSVAYSKFSAKKITKSLVMEVKYTGGFSVEQIAKGFERIELDGGYSSFNLGFDPNASFNFNINTSYGGFNNHLQKVDLRKQIEQGQNNTYEGTVGGGGNSNVRLTAKYGSIKFQ